MFGSRYFGERYFGESYWGPPDTLSDAGDYFGNRYWGLRYFGKGYWGQGEEIVVTPAARSLGEAFPLTEEQWLVREEEELISVVIALHEARR